MIRMDNPSVTQSPSVLVVSSREALHVFVHVQPYGDLLEALPVLPVGVGNWSGSAESFSKNEQNEHLLVLVTESTNDLMSHAIEKTTKVEYLQCNNQQAPWIQYPSQEQAEKTS